MKHYGNMLPALFGAAGVALAVGLGGVGALPDGTVVTTQASDALPAGGAALGSPQACIVGLNCGCIPFRTCPGQRHRPRVHVPAPQMEGDAPALTSEHGVAPAAVTRIPVWASQSA